MQRYVEVMEGFNDGICRLSSKTSSTLMISACFPIGQMAVDMKKVKLKMNISKIKLISVTGRRTLPICNDRQKFCFCRR